MQISGFFRLIPKNGFLFGLFAAVGLAWFLPAPGLSGGLLHSEFSVQAGIMVIFFLQGWILPTENLKNDLFEWRLHLFVQIFNFVVIPVLVLVFVSLIGGFVERDLMVGFLFLAILPTTVSTCVVFTTIAGGNVAGAIFNASLSNIIGVFAVPAWSAWLLTAATGERIPVGPLFLNIAMLILAPLFVGQALRPFTRKWLSVSRKSIGRLNTAIILFVIYVAFAGSFQSAVWAERGIRITAVAFASALILLTVVKILVWTAAVALDFGSPNRITAFFCASQKTLAAGVPMAQSIFSVTALDGGGPVVGVVLLPLMCYHFLQLAAGGYFVGFFKTGGDS